MANYHVSKKGTAWQAKKEKGEKASTIVPTQKEAEKIAKDLSKKSGGGEVRIHGLNGKIRDSDTVAPAKDPFPPKDLKH
jgi:hypothetical protein